MSNQFIEDIEKLQQNYYSKNNKNILFKNKQKLDCAINICNEMNIEDLLNKTIIVIPNTNIIYVDYTIFKLYANPSNYSIVVDRILKTFDFILQTYPNFEPYINLNSFTISAAERYKDLIKLFCDSCLKSTTRYSKLITKMYVLNVPSAFDNVARLLTPFIDVYIRERISLHTKDESAIIIQNLMSIKN
jgi:hypothetical protein